MSKIIMYNNFFVNCIYLMRKERKYINKNWIKITVSYTFSSSNKTVFSPFSQTLVIIFQNCFLSKSSKSDKTIYKRKNNALRLHIMYWPPTLFNWNWQWLIFMAVAKHELEKKRKYIPDTSAFVIIVCRVLKTRE